jgi:hypothetical protein
MVSEERIREMEWNVKVPVVEVINAPDAASAVADLTGRLRAAGFDTDYALTESDAFLSEDQS